MNGLLVYFDFDAFFAAIEERDRKIYKTPIIIGGSSRRSVVSTCNYEARKYGVKSGMSIIAAKNICPIAQILPVRYHLYQEVSAKVFDIISSITSEEVQRLSIDEGYVCLNCSYEEALNIIKEIKRLIKEKESLTVSVGIAHNLLLAKIASDYKKPDGVTVIRKDEVYKYLENLEIGKIYGIGIKTASKFYNMGLYKVKDVYNMPIEFYRSIFGDKGISIYEKIHGIDTRVASANNLPKSYGKEKTLEFDTRDEEDLKFCIKAFSDDIEKFLKENNYSCRTINLKYKYVNFETHTKSKSLEFDINEGNKIYLQALELLSKIEVDKGIRLIGLSVSNLNYGKIIQTKFI